MLIAAIASLPPITLPNVQFPELIESKPVPALSPSIMPFAIYVVFAVPLNARVVLPPPACTASSSVIFEE